MRIRDKLIKLLGGYTKKEYERSEQKFKALLDSKTDSWYILMCNEHMYNLLKDLYMYAKNELYGLDSNIWASRMFNAIKNNMFRVLVRYVHCRSAVFYKFDSTLDSKDQFKHVLEESDDPEELQFILEND